MRLVLKLLTNFIIVKILNKKHKPVFQALLWFPLRRKFLEDPLKERQIVLKFESVSKMFVVSIRVYKEIWVTYVYNYSTKITILPALPRCQANHVSLESQWDPEENQSLY